MSSTRFKPGDRIVHKHDPAWRATVLTVAPDGVRVRRTIAGGSIEATFDASDIKLVEPAQKQEA